MFGKKKEAPKRRDGKGLSQYGLFDIPDVTNLNDEGSDADDNDSDLEAELAAITVGGGAKPRRRPKPKADPLAVDLDAMIAASMKDIGSDEELSGDDDDPDLLNELSEITGEEEETQAAPAEAPPIVPTSDASVSTAHLLETRLDMYKKAEANAKAANETSRARRFNRGIKTINDLLKQARAGKTINPDDIPPEVSTGARPEKPAETPVDPSGEDEAKPTENELPSPARPAPAPPIQADTKPDDESEESDPRITLLTTRKNEYKIAALSAKRSGDSVTALKYIKIVKQFDVVISAIKNGDTVDLSDMPGPPGSEEQSSGKQESEMQQSADVAVPVAPMATEEPSSEELGEPEVLITASSVMEALEQRLAVYKGQMDAATQSNNSSKARRMGRIVKQFEQAIKLHKAGKPIPVDELPTPPGYAPIPGTAAPAASAEVPPAAPKPAPAPRPAPVPSTSTDSDSPEKPKTSPKPPARKGGNQATTSHTEKQAEMLMARQKEFKAAALAAKQKGEIAQAKELLRTAKGFDPLIQAALGGLPVDMKTLPIPNAARSQLEDSFAFVNADNCTEDESGESDVLTRLEDQLTRQLKLCLSTRDHHKAMGDVAGTNRFEHLALSVTKDLDIVRAAQRKNQPPPEFHYETKSFNVVQCCTELGDNDLEVTVVKGYNYTVPNPKEVDTYVKIEFPFPQDSPFIEYTPLVKDTNNPDYGSTYTIPMQRSSRHCLRVFKRHNLKLEIYARRGFFRSDALIGTVNVKLQPLETKCVLHDSFQVIDGRKPTGGKLEVKLRVRNPMLTKQVEQLTEKWLIIDN